MEEGKMMEQEIWKDIIGYEGAYQISSLGRVKSLEKIIYRTNQHKHKRRCVYKEKILKCIYRKTNYQYVVLYKNGDSGKKFAVHRLIAINFILNKENKPCINHIDGNPRNNTVSNLEWCTHKENTKHAIDTGLYNQFKKDGVRIKLTPKDVFEIRQSKERPTRLAKKYNIEYASVYNIRNYRTWKHL